MFVERPRRDANCGSDTPKTKVRIEAVKFHDLTFESQEVTPRPIFSPGSTEYGVQISSMQFGSMIMRNWRKEFLMHQSPNVFCYGLCGGPAGEKWESKHQEEAKGEGNRGSWFMSGIRHRVLNFWILDSSRPSPRLLPGPYFPLSVSLGLLFLVCRTVHSYIGSGVVYWRWIFCWLAQPS